MLFDDSLVREVDRLKRLLNFQFSIFETGAHWKIAIAVLDSSVTGTPSWLKTISADTGVAAATAHRAISSMEKAGLLLITEDSVDRRRSVITATEKLRSIILEFIEHHSSLYTD